MTPTLTLVGFGLLASSLAASIRHAGHPVRLQAVSSPSTTRKALEQGLVDAAFGYDELEKWVESSDCILLCTPVNHIVTLLGQLAAYLPQRKKTILISDIGSTKQIICQHGKRLPAPYSFVGGHPMAGSEKRGMEHADPSLYENAYWILCPSTSHHDTALLQQVIQWAGAHLVELTPSEHDSVMAYLSHVPQLLSTALASGLPESILQQGQQHLAGRGFRDMTRIAASPWPMWRDIINTNPQAIRQGLGILENQLQKIRQAIDSSESQQLQNLFEKGAEVRSSLSSPGKGFAQALHEVLIQISDQPGMILQIVQPLATAGINILDIELAKVREGIGGTLLLGFKLESEALQAVALLKTLGIEARIRL